MSKQSEFAVLLGMNPLFSGLGANSINKIAALCHTHHLAAGEVLFQKGDRG
jgi:CRP/FNR family cyclic AMP-dependent transcriptional regulator